MVTRPREAVPFGEFDSATLTAEFPLHADRWRINVGRIGHDVAGVSLIDIRRREFPLHQIDEKTFAQVTGTIGRVVNPSVPANHLRAVPVYYYISKRRDATDNSYRAMIYLWPAPLTAWRIRVKYVVRPQARYGPRRINAPLGLAERTADYTGEGSENDSAA
jgi:hypothetical protein